MINGKIIIEGNSCRIEGSQLEILYLYFQLVKKLIKYGIADKEMLINIIKLTDYTSEFQEGFISNERMKEIIKEMEGK